MGGNIENLCNAFPFYSIKTQQIFRYENIHVENREYIYHSMRNGYT